MFLELLILHVVASAISLFGASLIWHHRVTRARQAADPAISPGEKRHLELQYRRRMQSSSMIVVLGLLLHASNEYLVNWQQAPAGFVIYISLMLILAAWIVVLAMGDFLANQVVHQAALTRLHEQQRQLEQSLLQLRQPTETPGSEHSGT